VFKYSFNKKKTAPSRYDDRPTEVQVDSPPKIEADEARALMNKAVRQSKFYLEVE